MLTRSPRTLALATTIVAATLTLAACGSDDDTSGAQSSATTEDATAGEATPATEASPASTGAVPSPEADPAEDAFPVTIEHKFGSTTIESKPTRIVSVGYHEQDFIASLGTPPVMGRIWIADIVNPWSEHVFGDAEPDSFEAAEIPVEAVAEKDPDLIVGVYSWIDDQDYEVLSEIAPTLAQSGDVGDGQMSWQDQLSWIGRAMGESEQAQQLIDEMDTRFEAERAAHPEWEGLKLAVVHTGPEGGEFVAYASADPRMRFFAELGFDTTALDHLATDEGDFNLSFSLERFDELADLDVVVWYGADKDAYSISNTLPIHSEGREIWLEDDKAALFGFQTNLSIGATLDLLVPELELAADGDPATVVPTAAAAGVAPEE